MKYYRSVIVKQAQSWLGRKESDGSHKEIIDVYNSHKPLARGYKLKYTSAWCSGFASAVAIKCGYTAIIPTEVGCEKHINLFKQMNIWIEDDSYVPSAGDYIFYDWEDSGVGENKGSANHVGIVEKVEGNTITVIEGNYSSAVKRRIIKVNGKYIRGYGVPKYDDELEKPQNKPETSSNKFNIGDKVVISGSLYRSSNADSPSGKVINKTTNITRIAKGAKHPYNTTGDLGWMDESSIKLASNEVVYTVKKGDTLSGIAKRYNTTWQKIYENNKEVIGDNPNLIKPNQELVIK